MTHRHHGDNVWYYVLQHTWHTAITVTMSGIMYYNTHNTPPSRWQCLVLCITTHMTHRHHGDNVWYYVLQHITHRHHGDNVWYYVLQHITHRHHGENVWYYMSHSHSTHITPPPWWQCRVSYVTRHISHHHGDNVTYQNSHITPPSLYQCLVLCVTAHIYVSITVANIQSIVKRRCKDGLPMFLM